MVYNKFYENKTCVNLQYMNIPVLNEEMYPESVVNFLVTFLPKEICLTRKCSFFVKHAPSGIENIQIPDNVKIYYDACASVNYEPLITFNIFSDNEDEFRDVKSSYFTRNYHMEEVEEIEMCGENYYTVEIHRKLENDGTDEVMTDNEKQDVSFIIKEITNKISYTSLTIKILENTRWWHIEIAVRNHFKNKLKISMCLCNTIMCIKKSKI